MKNKKPEIIVICGPTATGKSDYAVKLAKKIGGEIISADSRQVYKGMDIGSGKITKKEMKGVPHYMLDIMTPKKVYTAGQFKKDADKIINDILKRKKIPIICGGTGFYIDAVVKNIIFPEVLPNEKLRKELGDKSLEKLQKILGKLDPERLKTVDQNNKVRLIRSIEIAKELGKVPELISKPQYDSKIIYLDFKDEVLKKRIHYRLMKRIKQGMVSEIKKLHENGVSWKRLFEFGLEYRYVSLFLRGKITKDKMISELENEIWHFVKRQRTWFKKH
ncbi:MAG: tRNA (adenosine(37)-N6)-dimethylallyltransferase MiaA [Candidatus Paceibacterota bacterium]